MLRTILAILIILPNVSHAEIKESFLNFKEYTLTAESCDRDLKSLAQSLCAVTSSELKEIYRDHFRMRTNAEDSLDEWFVFSDSLKRLIKVYRYTDFNEPASYDANLDYCYIRVACYK